MLLHRPARRGVRIRGNPNPLSVSPPERRGGLSCAHSPPAGHWPTRFVDPDARRDRNPLSVLRTDRQTSDARGALIVSQVSHTGGIGASQVDCSIQAKAERAPSPVMSSTRSSPSGPRAGSSHRLRVQPDDLHRPARDADWHADERPERPRRPLRRATGRSPRTTLGRRCWRSMRSRSTWRATPRITPARTSSGIPTIPTGSFDRRAVRDGGAS